VKVLVTGATGFIGAWIARALIEGGHSVRATIRPGARRDRLEQYADRIEWVTADVFGDPQLDRSSLCMGIDLCVHSAWYAVPGQYLEAPENVTCLNGSLALLGALADARVPRAVFVGTCFECDFDFGYLSESTPIRPLSLYAAAKSATRLVCERLARSRNMSFGWVRPFYQYGPFEDSRRLVPYVIDALLRGDVAELTQGTQVRDFLHVADVGSAIAAAAVHGLDGIVHIGSGRPVTVRQVATQIADLLGARDQLRFGARPDAPGDPRFICANPSKLIDGTGWSPRFDLESGLADTIASRRRARSDGGPGRAETREVVR
jgi:nucleoside-diphosphate-sugar epimerase